MIFVNLGYGQGYAVLAYRLNRALAAIFVGFLLSVSGCLLQSSLRNPLVDHYILGIGGGALFATYVYILLLPFTMYGRILSAIIGGLTALSITILVAEAIGGSDIAYVLVGIGVSTTFSGLSILLSYFVVAKNPYAMHILLGSLVLVSGKWIPILLILLILDIILYFILAKPLNVMMLGDEYAFQLGYNPRFYRLLATLLAGVTSSIVVSCCGLIGFLGLVIPHFSRFLLNTSDNRLVIPLSGLLGSVFLLLADNASRLVLVSEVGEVPVGALVSILGAPFYIMILVKRIRGR